MNWFTGLVWLASRATRRAAAEDPDDRGDMGTAFGLDASFGPSEFEQLPARPAAQHCEHRLGPRSRF